jgi:branched-chain amino acid transport system permease protein
MHSLTGALLSVIILTTLPELLRQFAIWRLVLYGGLVIIIMIVRPEGLLGSRELRLKSFSNAWKWISTFFARKN